MAALIDGFFSLDWLLSAKRHQRRLFARKFRHSWRTICRIFGSSLSLLIWLLTNKAVFFFSSNDNNNLLVLNFNFYLFFFYKLLYFLNNFFFQETNLHNGRRLSFGWQRAIDSCFFFFFSRFIWWWSCWRIHCPEFLDEMYAQHYQAAFTHNRLDITQNI